MTDKDFVQSVLGAPDTSINPATGLQGKVKSPVLSNQSFEQMLHQGDENPIFGGSGTDTS
jgi:hypothetical protein